MGYHLQSATHTHLQWIFTRMHCMGVMTNELMDNIKERRKGVSSTTTLKIELIKDDHFASI